MTPPGNNKRREERLEALLFVNLQNVHSKENVGRGVIRDVSRRGFMVETETELNNGDDLNCLIEIPVSFKAKVMWKKMPGQIKQYGFSYKDLSFFDKWILKRFLKGPRRTGRV
jgi:hypothetical protein